MLIAMHGEDTLSHAPLRGTSRPPQHLSAGPEEVRLPEDNAVGHRAEGHDVLPAALPERQRVAQATDRPVDLARVQKAGNGIPQVLCVPAPGLMAVEDVRLADRLGASGHPSAPRRNRCGCCPGSGDRMIRIVNDMAAAFFVMFVRPRGTALPSGFGGSPIIGIRQVWRGRQEKRGDGLREDRLGLPVRRRGVAA